MVHSVSSKDYTSSNLNFNDIDSESSTTETQKPIASSSDQQSTTESFTQLQTTNAENPQDIQSRCLYIPAGSRVWIQSGNDQYDQSKTFSIQNIPTTDSKKSLIPQESSEIRHTKPEGNNSLELTKYWNDPEKTVLQWPFKALAYSTAIKIVSLFIALVFPSIGFSIFGVSIALIDRVIILNFRKFSGTLINNIQIDWLQKLLNPVLSSDS